MLRHRVTTVGLLTAIFVFSHELPAQQEVLALRKGESLQQFGARVVPKDGKILHAVVRGDFGPTNGNVVILFGSDGKRGFAGWVLVPEGPEYRKLILPDREFPASTEIRAVFFAQAGHEGRALFVLCKHISGVGRYPGNITPFYTTYVYGSDGNRITELVDVEDQLDPVGSLSTAHQVLQRLRELGS
jgi:hypothetical protein